MTLFACCLVSDLLVSVVASDNSRLSLSRDQAAFIDTRVLSEVDPAWVVYWNVANLNQFIVNENGGQGGGLGAFILHAGAGAFTADGFINDVLNHLAGVAAARHGNVLA